jgi:hypothetical protein
MMIVAGESLSEPERQSSWTDYGVVRRGQTIYPIEGPMGLGRFQCYFGHADTGLIIRFENQASRLFSAALELLGPQGLEYQPLPFGLGGWVYLCYCMAWDHPDLVDYKVEFEAMNDFERAALGTKRSVVHPGLFTQVCFGTKGPFVDRHAFTFWSENAAEYAEGVFFGKLSEDVRSCSVSAIDAILSLVADQEKAREPRRRPNPALEPRNKWIYEQYCAGVSLKLIVQGIKQQDKSWDKVCEQYIRPIAVQYAKDHNLPSPPRRQDRQPVLKSKVS